MMISTTLQEETCVVTKTFVPQPNLSDNGGREAECLLTDCTGQAKLLLLLLRLRLLRCSVLPAACSAAPFNGALAHWRTLLILNNSFINFNTPRVVMSCPTTQPEKACKKMPLNVPNPYHILFSGGFPFLKIGVISMKTKFFFSNSE